MVTPPKGTYNNPAVVLNMSPTYEKYKNSQFQITGQPNNHILHKSDLMGSNSKDHASIITVEQENDLRGEISYCKEEVDHLKQEIKKFNEVLKNKIVYEEDWSKDENLSRSGRKRRPKSNKYTERINKSYLPKDQSSLYLNTISKQGNLNTDQTIPGLSPSKSNNVTYERILDTSMLNKSPANINKYQQNTFKQDYTLPARNHPRNTENVSQNQQRASYQNYVEQKESYHRQSAQNQPLQEIKHLVNQSRLDINNPRFDYRLGSFGGKTFYENSPAHSHSSKAASLTYCKQNQSELPVQNNCRPHQSQNNLTQTSVYAKTPYPSTIQLTNNTIKQSPRYPSTQTNEIIQPRGESNNNPRFHKELIENLQDEVNFLAKQNTKLKSALMNSSGIGLISTYHNLYINGMESVNRQVASISMVHQRKIDGYETKMQQVTRSIKYLKGKISSQNINAEKHRKSAAAQIKQLQTLNEGLKSENSNLNKDAFKMAEVLSQKELMIEKLLRENDLLKTNQFTDVIKKGNFFLFKIKF